MTKKTFVALTLFLLLLVPMRSKASSIDLLLESDSIDAIKQVMDTVKNNVGNIQAKVKEYANMIKGPMSKAINMIAQHSNHSFNSGHNSNSTNRK